MPNLKFQTLKVVPRKGEGWGMGARARMPRWWDCSSSPSPFCLYTLRLWEAWLKKRLSSSPRRALAFAQSPYHLSGKTKLPEIQTDLLSLRSKYCRIHLPSSSKTHELIGRPYYLYFDHSGGKFGDHVCHFCGGKKVVFRVDNKGDLLRWCVGSRLSWARNNSYLECCLLLGLFPY